MNSLDYILGCMFIPGDYEKTKTEDDDHGCDYCAIGACQTYSKPKSTGDGSVIIHQFSYNIFPMWNNSTGWGKA